LEQYRSSSRASSLEDEPATDLPDPKTDVLGTVAKQMEEGVREILEEMPERDRRIIRGVSLKNATRTRSAEIFASIGTISVSWSTELNNPSSRCI